MGSVLGDLAYSRLLQGKYFVVERQEFFSLFPSFFSLFYFLVLMSQSRLVRDENELLLCIST